MKEEKQIIYLFLLDISEMTITELQDILRYDEMNILIRLLGLLDKDGLIKLEGEQIKVIDRSLQALYWAVSGLRLSACRDLDDKAIIQRMKYLAETERKAIKELEGIRDVLSYL